MACVGPQGRSSCPTRHSIPSSSYARKAQTLILRLLNTPFRSLGGHRARITAPEVIPMDETLFFPSPV